MASVAFRLTIYQANGTTPDLTVTSVRGGTNPYIVDVPSGDGQEVDLLTGAVRSGAYNVRVADVVTGSTVTGTVRLVTTKLEDADYRQHLLSRRATLECSRNGGSTWAIWTSGYLTALRQTDAMTYEFTVSDSRRLESTHTAFTWWSDTNKTTDERREFPNRGCLMGGPLIENFGPIRASGGWEFRWREVQSGYLALAFTAAYDPPAYQRSQYFNPAKFRADARTFLRRLPPVASLTGTNFEQLRDREFVWGYPELLAAVTDGTTTWYGSVRAAFTPVNYSGSGAGDRNLGPDVERSNFIFVELDPNQSTSYPSSNAKVRVRILQREVSEISPIYIDEHPVDIAVKLYKTVGIPYNSSSVTSTKAAVGDDVRLALRIGEPVNMGEFLSNAIFGPFGFSARTNSSGEQEFFPTRIANATAPTTTIAVNDIVGDAPPPVFEVDEGTVVTSFRLTAQALTQFVPDSDNKVEPPSDGLVAIENTQVVQNADTTTFSTREVAYEIPGMVHDGSASGAAFVLSPEVVGRFFTGIVAEGFDRFGRGAIVSEVQVLASSTAASLQVGDEVVLNIPYYPNKNYRIGESTVGTRIAQIVRRTEMPEGPIFKLVDSGVNQQPTSPTFTIASWTGDPRRVAQVTVTNAGTLNTAQVTLAVQYQVSANTPTKTGTLFTRFRPGTIPTGAFLLPTVPPGSKVWVRMRTEKTELRASAWTSWTSVTLTSWTAPTSLAAGATTANSVSLSWSLAGNTLDPMDVFAYPGASAPADWTPYRITTLSAGSTTTIVRDLNPSTQYTFGVAFKDIGTGAYSGFTTVTASTNAVNTSTCPAAPKMKVITSFDTAGSTTGVVLSLGAIEGYNVVVQRAPNVAGSPGTWADIAVLAPLTGYYADILPSDGVTRWYRVFYRLSGFLDGAPGTARSAVPVAIPDDLILTEGPSIISGGSSLSFGNYLTGTPDSFYDGSTAQSVAVDATSANTANKVVARDNTGSFSANVVTATLDGPAPAGQLTGSTLAANVLSSSLTSVGTIGTGVWEGTSIGKNYGGTGLTSTAFAGITNERVFAYDGASGAFFIAPSGSNGQALVYSGGALAWGNPAPGSHVLADTTGLGSQHTTSGLTAGMILQATGATTARFQTPSIPASSVTAGTFSGTSYTITNDLTVSGTLTASLPWSSITSTPTTLSGYGITDALSNSTSSTQSGYFGDIYLWDDATPSHYLQITNSANLTAARTLSINVNDASRTISLSGNLTVSGNADISGTSSGTNTGDQTITLTGAITGSGTGSFATTYAGTVPIAKGGTNQTAYSTTGTGTRVVVYDQGFGRFDVQPAGTAGQFLKSSGTAGDVLWDTPPNFTSTTAGYAPASGGGTSNFLRADGSWAVPSVGSVSANNVTAGTFAGASYTFSNSVTFTSGVRVANGETYKILNSGGTAVDVLSATTLGTGVINSSLTSVGTLTSGALGAGFTAIDNARLANSSITINGTAVSLGGSITLPLTQWTTSGSDIYYNSGNVTVGTTSVASFRLFSRGAGTTNATYAFGAENSAQTSLFLVRNDGAVSVPNGLLTASAGISTTTISASGKALIYNVAIGGTASGTYAAYTDSVVGFGNLHLATPDGAVYINAALAKPTYINPVGGDVGIGTTAPNAALEINRATNAAQLQISGSASATETTGIAIYTGTSRRGFIGWRGTSSSGFAIGGMHFINYDNSPIVFATTATEAGRFSLEGNLSVGTTSQYTGTNVRSISIGAPAYPALAFYANDVYKAGIIVAGANWTFGTVVGNHITFEPGGSEKVVFKDNGWVGIGTGSPANRLHIVGANTASRGQLTVVGSSTDARITLYSDSSFLAAFSASSSDSYIGTESNTPFRFITNGSEKVRIAAGGDVAIGRNSTNNNRLFVSGTHTSGRALVGLQATDNGANLLGWFSAADVRYGYINVPLGGAYELINEQATAMTFYTNSLERLRIASGGNVGIGTTNPANGRLQVNASIRIDDDAGGAGSDTFGGSSILYIGSTGGGGAFQYDASRGIDLWQYNTGGSWARTVRFTRDGSVGIGTTSPAAKLTVYGTTEGQYLTVDAAAGFAGLSDASNAMVQFRNSSDGNTLLIRTNNSVRTDAAPLSVWTQTTSRFLVRNDGNIGIGTSSPDYRLTILTPTSDATVGFNLRAYTTGADGDRTVISRYTSSNNSNWAWSEYHAWAHIWKANGVEQMRLNSSGNVGIGTTNPGGQLEVSRSDGGRQMLLVRNYSAGSTGAFTGNYAAEIRTAYTAGAYGGALLVHTQEASDARPTMAVSDSNGVFATFVNGKVGIGTASPGFLLHVKASGNYGTIASDNSSNTGGGGFAVRKNGSTIGVLANKGAWYGDTTNDLIVAAETGYNFRIYTNGSATEKFLFTTGGNFLLGGAAVIGTNTSDGSDDTYLALSAAGGDGPSRGGHIYLSGNERSADAGNVVIAAGNVSTGSGAPGAIVFRTGNGSERARITPGGDAFVGTTTSWSSARFVSERNSTSVPAAEFNGTGQTAGLAPVYIWNNAESGSTYFISFYSDGVNNPRTLRGYINYRRDIATINLTTASDYRIKTIHGLYTKSGEVFDKIQVHDGTMHGASMCHVPMVVAHELEEAVPYAVEGEKDAINEDGTPKLQMVSYTAMIPLMLAEIKSLRARVAELEAR